MNVMDMTPEELFALLEPMRQAKVLKALDVRRCSSHYCFHIGKYEHLDCKVVIATRVKFSPGKCAELGLPNRVIPGRAWLGAAPGGEIYGCSHTFELTTDDGWM